MTAVFSISSGFSSQAFYLACRLRAGSQLSAASLGDFQSALVGSPPYRALQQERPEVDRPPAPLPCLSQVDLTALAATHPVFWPATSAVLLPSTFGEPGPPTSAASRAQSSASPRRRNHLASDRCFGWIDLLQRLTAAGRRFATASGRIAALLRFVSWVARRTHSAHFNPHFANFEDFCHSNCPY